jgi:hypothetical protein
MEGNLDAERAKKCLRPAQVAGESARISRPAKVVASVTGAFSADPQKISSAARPDAVLGHEAAHPSGDRVDVDHVLDRGFSVDSVGARESARGPEARFASRGP